jgi:hypothetical protein
MCTLNSQCKNPLSCAFGRCHNTCVESRDCPSMQRCVRAPGAEGTVCQYEPACKYKSDCLRPLVCALDRQCRNECQVDLDCPTKTQKCVLPDRVCAEPEEIDPATQQLRKTQSIPVPDGPDAADGGAVDADAGADATSPDAPVEAAPPNPSLPLGFAPSNFALPPVAGADADPPKDVAVAMPCDGRCLPTPVPLMLADGSMADLYVVQTFRIETTAALSLSGLRPVVIAALDSVAIEGQLLVNAAAERGGPGGFSSEVAGPGAGAAGQTAGAPNSGGGGGSYCGLGGLGGTMAGMPGIAAKPGRAYGTPELVPLIGGSPGGAASYYGVVHGGGGGGAVQIVARGSIKVGMFGIVSAAGAGGGSPGAGGGSGGAILLEAPVVTVQGRLAANGGGGGGTKTAMPGLLGGSDDQPAAGAAPGGSGSAGAMPNGTDAGMDWSGGGGGAGRIRINSGTGAAAIAPTAIVSPGLTTPCATQGRLGG